VLVLHRDGLVTVYAHNRQNLVSAGERVRRGQTIAELGNTGISRGPHVHFEFLHAGKNCDPTPLFRPGVPHRPGHLGPLTAVEWPEGAARPDAVRCDTRRQHPGYGEGALASSAHPDAEADEAARQL
jgi:murein DD-endopeptidase MepM/ murein hydrolase activator NlpD